MFGVVIALGIMEFFLRTFPNLVPTEVRVNPPVRRVRAFVNETYDLKQSDGDLYNWLRGSIAPLSPDQDKVVAHVHMTTDAHGFRNSLPEKATYDIVALGDSFTRASGVAIPWPQKLAEHTGSDVLNLADVGMGPQEELEILRQYGLEKQPRWVIMAYFGGNDMNDAAAYELANPFILARLGRYAFTQGIEAWRENNEGEAIAAHTSNYRYPIVLKINGSRREMAFLPAYIAWWSLCRDEIESSKNYHYVKEAILKAREISEVGKSSFLLVYIPSKEQTYLPYVNDAETLATIFSDVPTIEQDVSGYLQLTPQKVAPELTCQQMDNQAQLLAGFAAEQNINFLDLTQHFQEEASAGAELYYPFDTHWNQNGHNLAAQIIAKYINSGKSFVIRSR